MMEHEERVLGCFSPFKHIFRRIITSPKRTRSTLGEIKNNDSAEEQYTIGRKAVDSLPPYSFAQAATDEEILRTDILHTMEARIDELGPELKDISLKIHRCPELMFKEEFAHDTLTEFMSSHGFTVTPHYLELSTAWRASFKHGNGGPVIGVNSEMDALPGIGHACGHNLIAIAGVGIALGIKAALEAHDIAGEVVLLGTPAEEGGGGKIILLDRGGYEGMDACIMCHPGPGPDLHFEVMDSLAVQMIEVEFHGHTAHASGAPWEGINALDAAVLSYTSISVLRQQIKPTHRVHGIIEGRDWAPNVIPDYAKLSYIVRAPTGGELEELAKRVTACFDAAAQATGCTHQIYLGLLYSALNQNSVLSREFAKVATKRYNMTEAGPNPLLGSTDFGNISNALPGLHPGYTISATSVNHTLEFAKAASTPEAHAATLYTTKALAATGLRLLTDEAFLQEVKDSFEATKAVSKV